MLGAAMVVLALGIGYDMGLVAAGKKAAPASKLLARWIKHVAPPVTPEI